MKLQRQDIEKFHTYNDIISIIVPVYNCEKFLIRTLDSILNQTYPHWEAILVNDGSTDHSFEIITDYAQKDKRFKIVNQTNKGVSASRNLGIDIAKGTYICFFDSDDMLYPQFLELMLTSLKKYNVDMVWCKSKRCDEEANLDFCNTYQKYDSCIVSASPYEQFFCHRKPKLQITAWGKLYKKEILQNLRFSSQFKSLAEDFFFSMNLFLLINKMVYIANPLIAYRHNSASLTNKDFSFSAVDDHILLLKLTYEHLHNKLPHTMVLNMQRRISHIVFRYCCIFSYFLKPQKYKEYWEKYSIICKELSQNKIFCISPIFHRLLYYLFINRHFSTLKFILYLYRIFRI